MYGLFVFNKPAGISSAGFLNRLKYFLAPRCGTTPRRLCIGHGGTLDPFATGVLIVGIGRKYTKLLHTILNIEKKEYRATIVLGARSSTDDYTGVITPQATPITPSKSDIQDAIAYIVKQKTQIPPAISAIKIRGVPAYARARKGEDISLSQKEASVFSYSLESVSLLKDAPSFLITLSVSSGFYIRSFARDVGNVLGVGGYVRELHRVSVGRFMTSEALEFCDIENDFIELFIRLRGLVQGVGYRSYIVKIAQNWPITGIVYNTDDNGLEIVAQGNMRDLTAFLDMAVKGHNIARVDSIFDYFRKPSEKFSSFELVR